jgi:transcriptional regulator with XRE-family HTH domain
MIKDSITFIKNLREQKGISQADLAKRLGISRTSYIAVEQNKRDISLGEIEKLAKILGFSFEELEQKELPNYTKYRQMILAFLRKNEEVTKTKLAKLLYFADFAWYYKHLESMSGMQYRRISYGPVADTYFRLIDEMQEQGEIAIEYKSEGAMMISETRSGAKINLDAITPEQDKLIGTINKKWDGKKTSEIVDFTHKQLPYLYAKDNELVSYGLFTQEDPDEIF